MAIQVVAKKVKKAAATDSSRLVNSPKPCNGNPRTVPPPGCCGFADCINWEPPSSRIQFDGQQRTNRTLAGGEDRGLARREPGTKWNPLRSMGRDPRLRTRPGTVGRSRARFLVWGARSAHLLLCSPGHCRY